MSSCCQVAVGGHFVFVGVIGGVVDGCVCGCGFTIYVNFYFIGLVGGLESISCCFFRVTV